MNTPTNSIIQSKQIILRDVHCPYCEKQDAFLISEQKGSTISMNFPPAYGLKFLLSFIFLSIVHIFINGFKYFEITRKIEYTTYGFCPVCGNSYPASAPNAVIEETSAPKFCKIRNNKAVTGLCKGISEYTGISVLWIRTLTFLYFFTVMGAFLYFIVAACVPAKEDLENGVINEKRFKRAKKGEGKVFFGICKGFSDYTDIPVMWVRILAVILGLGVIPAILYLIYGIVLSRRDSKEAKNGSK